MSIDDPVDVSEGLPSGLPPPKLGGLPAPAANNGLAPPPKANPLSRTSNTTRAHLTSVTFDSLTISALTKRAIAEVMGYQVCSAVQAQTLPVILQGHDVIAKAKTGTGKTIGFLLPTIERLAANPGPGVRAIAISPTRELAQQIRDECEQLITFHKPRLSSGVVFGGTNVKSDIKMLSSSPPSLLVATPGRLNDLLYNFGLAEQLGRWGLQSLIFDEADQLLEMGFRPDITKILTALQPSANLRQTLLFSATLPGDVQQVAQIATKGGAHTKLIDTVGEEEQATHAHVPQRATVTPIASQTAEIVALLQEVTGPNGVTGNSGYKVLVFFTTARLAQLYSELFEKLGYNILEMHSRKSQPHRTRVADQFREGSNLIMFSSDVSARGMDYPDVTAVIQVGMPSDKAQYIHRLGRTARAGKAGGGYLLLADFEASFLPQLSDLPVQQRPPIDAATSAQVQPIVANAFRSLPQLTLTCAYQAYLGFYNSYLKRLRWDREEVVRRANEFAMEVMQLPSPPALQAKTVGKMGLKGQRAAMLVEPSLPTPFLIAKEGIPKVQYDYTRGLDELNGIDVWADIPTTSEVNRAKGTDRVYQRTVKQNLAPAEKAPIDEPGYKSIREEIEEDRLKLAAKTAAAKAARAAKN